MAPSPRILMVANAFYSISGGDKILVEYGKRWMKSGAQVRILTNEKGNEFCRNHGFPPGNITVWKTSWSDTLGIFVSSAWKSVLSFVRACTFPFQDYDIVFSSSFIWPDLLPGLVAKLRYPHIVWVVTSYVMVPNPFTASYRGRRFSALLLFCVQKISLFIMRFFTDGVFVASETDKKLFHLHSSKTENVIAVRGGVDYAFFQSVRVQPRLYDAIFVGRYHPQKNIDELLDIWQAVLMKRPMSQLAIIGGGALEKHLIHKVQQLGISANVKFLGTMDGIMKAKALKAANIFISASKFDSGNLALDESLACGTPGVIYAIPHLQYPAGVIRVPIGDQKAFVSAIESLLGHPEARKALSEAGRKFAATLSWDSKARQAYSFLLNLWGFLK